MESIQVCLHALNPRDISNWRIGYGTYGKYGSYPPPPPPPKSYSPYATYGTYKEKRDAVPDVVERDPAPADYGKYGKYPSK
jgi:hypothetical protein